MSADRVYPTTLLAMPQENESYGFDFTARLPAGLTITSAVLTVSPAGPTLGAPSIAGAVVSFRVSGGTGGTTYHVLCVATLSDATTKLELLGMLEVGSE